MVVYSLTRNFTDIVFKHLMPTLKTKKTKKKEGKGKMVISRSSKFIEAEIKILEQMLTGEYALNKMKETHSDLRNKFTS